MLLYTSVHFTSGANVMFLNAVFIQRMKGLLESRLRSKQAILKIGGEQALAHSPSDLQRIRYALKRIIDNQYGLCGNCGTLIPEGRLESIPETPFCTGCAQDIEAH